ncbi:MAG: FAD-dependent oxidoreductase [Burkholderiaceae bacterium]
MPRGKTVAVWAGVVTLAVALFLAYRYFNPGQWLTLETLKQSRQALQAWHGEAPISSTLIFFAVYVVATALSVPGALILTLAAGAIFGFATGLLVVSFASSVGALLAFLAARYLLRDAVQRRFGKSLARINQGMREDGMLYLLTLRLVPLFPFWLVNLLMGLTPLTATRYYGISQLGMLPGTAVYVNAGTQLASIESTAQILSAELLGSLILLGVFPLLAKAVTNALRRRKLYAGWDRPKTFDRNLIVIGAGAGGLVSAYIGATVKARVTLIEEHLMGGDCLNTGCVPSKALIRAARAAKALKRAKEFGIDHAGGQVNFAAVMARVHRVIRDIEPHDSARRYRGMGVDVVQGRATLITPWEVRIDFPDGSQQQLTAKKIILATGAAPIVPNIPGLKEAGVLTSETLWQLNSLPQQLVVLGGGPIGCELAQSFARLGSRVILVEMGPALLPREDADAGALVAQALKDDGITVLTRHQALRVELHPQGKRLIVQHEGQEHALPFDHILCAVGRAARISGFGLEALGIALTERNTIATNALQQTSLPNIYAVGDAAGPLQLTHAAAHQAWYAAVNALFGRFRNFRNEHAVIPWITFTDPEVARVGLSETEAREKGIAFEITRYSIDDLDRAITDGAAHGFVKVLTPPGSDRILGATIVGEHAGEMLAEFVLAMKHGLGLNKILGTVHTYPTWAEANKYAAGEWKKAHAPQWLMPWLERYHAWERRR